MPATTRTAADRFAQFSSYDTTPRKALDLFAEVRGTCPVPHSEQLGGFHALLDFADVRAAMADWQTFSSSPSAVRPLSPDRPKAPPLDYDPPEHTAWRKLFHEAFNARTTSRVEAALSADVDRLIDAFAGRGSCDLIAEFAEEVPLHAICHIIGFDADQGPEARRRVTAMLASAADPAEAARTFGAFAEFGLAQVMRRRADPREDFLTALATATLDGRPLSPPEIGAMMIALLVAGTSTTSSGLGSLLYEVLSRPELAAALRSDPNRVPAAVEETLRLHPPVFGFFRRATRPVVVRGVEIGPDDTVYLCWAAANRDPEVFEDPQTFCLERGAARHLAFGYGVHACPGAQTGRFEMRLGLSALLRRLPDIRLAEGHVPDYAFGGTETAALTSLPAIFTPATT